MHGVHAAQQSRDALDTPQCWRRRHSMVSQPQRRWFASGSEAADSSPKSREGAKKSQMKAGSEGGRAGGGAGDRACRGAGPKEWASAALMHSIPLIMGLPHLLQTLFYGHV